MRPLVAERVPTHTSQESGSEFILLDELDEGCIGMPNLARRLEPRPLIITTSQTLYPLHMARAPDFGGSVHVETSLVTIDTTGSLQDMQQTAALVSTHAFCAVPERGIVAMRQCHEQYRWHCRDRGGSSHGLVGPQLHRLAPRRPQVVASSAYSAYAPHLICGLPTPLRDRIEGQAG